jgi:hypothetical protein
MIYLEEINMEELKKVIDKNYYDRQDVYEENKVEPNFYHFFNFLSNNIKPLPLNSIIEKSISTDEILVPKELFGVVFSKSPIISKEYKKSIQYWNDNKNFKEERKFVTDAGYYQNPLSEYMVNIKKIDKLRELEDEGYKVSYDEFLLSEGLVINIKNLIINNPLLKKFPDRFIEICFPLNIKLLIDDFITDAYKDFFQNENDNIKTTYRNEFILGEKNYYELLKKTEDKYIKTLNFYLKIEDILNSPHPDDIFIDAFRIDLSDYGYYY